MMSSDHHSILYRSYFKRFLTKTAHIST